MKNVQVIDGAMNTSYSIYAFTDQEFAIIFPESGQDVEFIEDVAERVGEEVISKVLEPVWRRMVRKTEVNGIHGTLFYQLDYKKKYYPTKKENGMIGLPPS